MRLRGAVLGLICLPPSAQTQMSSRPSGATKQKETTKNEGRRQAGRAGPRSKCANVVAQRHFALMGAENAPLPAPFSLIRRSPARPTPRGS